jgi:replicative DNA helicase
MDAPRSDEGLAVLPPHSSEAERAVLGSMLRDNAVIDDIALELTAEDFYADAHARVYRVLVALPGAGQVADLVTVANELHRRQEIEDVGGYGFLGGLLEAAPTAGNAGHYAHIVREKALLRGLIHASNHILRTAYQPTGTAAEAVEAAEKLIYDVAERSVAGKAVTIEQTVGAVFDDLDRWRAKPGAGAGVQTGFLDLDALIGGLGDSALALLGARPGQGKTAFACALARNVTVGQGRPVLFVSLEMSHKELGLRMMCAGARVDSHAARRGALTDEESARLVKAGEELRRAPLVIVDEARQGVLHIGAQARRMKRRQGLALVVIDYLQLVEPDNRRAQRYEQVGGVSRSLKALAKDLGAPVLALAQLSRAVEDRADQRPRLSDLRESGSLEQDSDTVLALHQPSQAEGCVDVLVLKQRSGPVGEARLAYDRRFTRFDDVLPDLPR